MKPNYGVVRSQQVIKTQRQQLQHQQHQRNLAGAAHQYYKNRREMMIAKGTCLQCEGSGTRFLFFTCSTCNGAGKVDHCQACNGRGRGWIFTCRFCNGSGRVG